MNGPNKSLVTLRPGLGAGLEEFNLAASRNGFIGHRMFPFFNVPVAADKFGRRTLASILQEYDDRRASGGGYSRSDMDFEDDFYATVEYGHEGVVDDRNLKLYENYFDAEIIVAEQTRDVVMRRHEVRCASKIHDTAVFTPNPVTNEWNDFAAATPILDVEKGVRVLRANGVRANCLQIGWETFRNLTLCDEIIEKVSSFGAGASIKPGDITVEDLKKCFKLEFIEVGDAQRNTAAKGLAADLDEIWSDEYAFVTRIATTNNIAEPCIGRCFHWAGDGSVPGGAFESYREDKVRGDILRCRHEVDLKLLYTAAGYLLSNIKDPLLTL